MDTVQSQVIALAANNPYPLANHTMDEAQKATQNQSVALNYRLQTSLAVPELVNQFAQGVRELIPCDGVIYENPKEQLYIVDGTESIHTSHYQLCIEKEGLGHMTFARATRFTGSELAKLETLLSVLMFPLRNALTYHRALKLATQDPLTGMGNRAGFEKALAQEINTVRRYGGNLSLLMLDLDHFKQINDTFGHPGGDEVLKHFGEICQECIRESDRTFRVGGEEFMILLRNTDTRGAVLLANRIGEKVDKTSTLIKSRKVQVTVSTGVATLQDGDNQKELVARADKALYRAKAAGRNCVKS